MSDVDFVEVDKFDELDKFVGKQNGVGKTVDFVALDDVVDMSVVDVDVVEMYVVTVVGMFLLS